MALTEARERYRNAPCVAKSGTQTGMKLLLPPPLSRRFRRNLRPLLRRQSRSASRTALQAPETAQRDRVRILRGVYRLWCGGVELWGFADGFEEDLVGKLVGVTRAF